MYVETHRQCTGNSNGYRLAIRPLERKSYSKFRSTKEESSLRCRPSKQNHSRHPSPILV